MAKFKVGDVVERTGALSFLWADFAAADAGPYVVTSVGAGWIQINGYRGHDGYDAHPFNASQFKLVEQDDPLPPAPESVRYYTVPSKTQYLDILPNEFGEVEIRSILPDFASYNYLTPDAALQLAHDLTRMAMEIKRRERAQSGE